ncbi:hypothetical protein [Inquilinus limosus]|uniref:Uncharacterized protein n=1 Tax=Inquilinus limosus TaxID=171674 RepID=A0A211Z1C8_9PROT|nr:hypothetical protein [Inquilinus limosus]OWJ59050.1 hypothetical protein BWR60_32745 [Inquilinus limosus]
MGWVLAGIAAALLMVLPAGSGHAEDDAALRAELLRSMRQGYAEAGPGAPNLLDLLSDRFPADLDTLMNTVVAAYKAQRPPDEVKTAVARTFVTIQARDGDRILSAPDADLAAVIATQADIVRTVGEGDGALCKALVSSGPAMAAPTPEIGRLFLARLHQILTAIADGRDRPVPARAMQDQDYRDFALAAQQRGTDIKAWSVLAADEMAGAKPGDVCRALRSTYEAALAAEGDLGGRIRADMAHDLLVTDLETYRPALEK